MEIDDVIVIDNFLNYETFLEFKDVLINDCYWLFTENISSFAGRDPRKFYGFGFTFVDSRSPNVYVKTQASWFIKHLNNKIKKQFNFNNVLRCRSDMTTYRGDQDIVLDPHTDLQGKHYTTIYYINNSDAPTIIYNEKIMQYEHDDELPDKLTEKKRIYPEENKLIVFDGNHIHSGMCPKKQPYRVLINSNFN